MHNTRHWESQQTISENFTYLALIKRTSARLRPSTQVEEIEGAEWQDLGMQETLWINRVKEFGPLIISIDTKGNNLISQNKVDFNERKKPVPERISKQIGFIK